MEPIIGFGLAEIIIIVSILCLCSVTILGIAGGVFYFVRRNRQADE